MNNMEVKSADDLAALVAANPSCQSPFNQPSPNPSAGRQMQNGVVVHVSTIETDEQLANRMAEQYLDSHFLGNATTQQDLLRNFTQAEIDACANRAQEIALLAVNKLAAKGIRRMRVKATTQHVAQHIAQR